MSAQDGLTRLNEQSFDLAVVDLLMPQMTGIEFLEELAQRESSLPVVMITGYPTIHTALHAMRLGAAAYVAKPFTYRELLTPVMRALRQQLLKPVTPPPRGMPSPDAGSLTAGMVVYLPRHAWARFQQDGLFEIGVEESFLAATGPVEEVVLPRIKDLVDQGLVGIKIRTESGEEHGVAMPLSGQVMEANAVAAGGKLDADTWLVRLLPTRLGSEVRNLVLR